MTTERDAYVAKVQELESELWDILDGMDYCLDWKPEPSAWSARQLVYHLLDTPPGGIPQVLSGILSGELREYEIWADRDNMTPERMGYDLEQLREDLGGYFGAMREALHAASDEDLDARSALAHLRSRDVDAERTARELLDRVLDGHWREHLDQMRGLRDALGM